MVVNDKKNFVYKTDFPYNQYFTLDELIEVKSIIDTTIEKYNNNKLTDEVITRLNNEKSKQINFERYVIKKPKKGLYLICQNKNFLKIGMTSDINRRTIEIKRTNPDNIKVLFFIENLYLLEKILHLKFDKLWHNSEWFYYDESIIEAFKLIKENKDILSKIKCKETLKEKIDKLLKPAL